MGLAKMAMLAKLFHTGISTAASALAGTALETALALSDKPQKVAEKMARDLKGELSAMESKCRIIFHILVENILCVTPAHLWRYSTQIADVSEVRI